MPRILGSTQNTARPIQRPVATPASQPNPRPIAVPVEMTVGRSRPPDGTSRGAHPIAYKSEYLDMFLAGTRVNCTSSRLKSFQFDRKASQLRVWMLDGFECTVLGVGEDLAAGLFTSASKGLYYWENLQHLPYLVGT